MLPGVFARFFYLDYSQKQGREVSKRFRDLDSFFFFLHAHFLVAFDNNWNLLSIPIANQRKVLQDPFFIRNPEDLALYSRGELWDPFYLDNVQAYYLPAEYNLGPPYGVAEFDNSRMKIVRRGYTWSDSYYDMIKVMVARSIDKWRDLFNKFGVVVDKKSGRWRYFVYPFYNNEETKFYVQCSQSLLFG